MFQENDFKKRKPKIIYTDNATTFKAGAKCLTNVSQDEQFQDLLSKEKHHGGETNMNV